MQFAAVSEGAPAAEAGVQADDIVLSVDGVEAGSPAEVTRQITSHEPGDEVTLELLRDGEPMTVDVTLGQRPDDPSTAFLGVSSAYEFSFVQHGLLGSIGYTFRDLADMGVQSVKGVVTVMNPVNLVEHLTGQNEDLSTRPTTLVGATNVSEDVGQGAGWAGMLMMLASINIFFGLFNLFPLLPFDGGHAAIATYERIRSRPGKRYFADVTKMMPVALAVMTLLGFMLFTGLYLDIAKPL